LELYPILGSTAAEVAVIEGLQCWVPGAMLGPGATPTVLLVMVVSVYVVGEVKPEVEMIAEMVR